MRRLAALLFATVVVLMFLGTAQTSDVAFAVTGSGTISVTIPAVVSIHFINSTIDFGTIDTATAQTATLGTTTVYVLDSENDALNAPAKLVRDEYDTNVEAVYYISAISVSTSSTTSIDFSKFIFVKRDLARSDYGYYTPGVMDVTLEAAGSSFTPTLPTGYTEIAQATYSTYVRSSSDGNTRTPTAVTFYFVLAQDSNGAKYLFVDDDTDFTDGATDSTPPVTYTALHQINTIYENPYTLAGTAFPAAAGDSFLLAQAAIAPADEHTSSTIMGFYVLIAVPTNANAITVTRSVTVTGEAV